MVTGRYGRLIAERQLPSSSYNYNALTTLRTSVKESLQMHFKVANEGITDLDVMRVFSVLWL